MKYFTTYVGDLHPMANPKEMADDLIAEGYTKEMAWRMVREYLDDKKTAKERKQTPKSDRTRKVSHE